MLLIGNAQGFWGDSPDAARRLLTQQPDIDYITLDYLAEVSLSIMAIQKDRDPSAGFAKDFIDVIQSLIPYWKKGSKVKIVTNAGGLNPKACADVCASILKESGCTKIIGVVKGDDVLSELKNNPSHLLFNNIESNIPLKGLQQSLVTANAYLGAEPIVRLLQQNVDIVITGRVADPSLTVAPCIAHYQWPFDSYDKIAGATIAGHLIECGTQVTGGISCEWMQLDDLENIGFPIVSVNSDGSFTLTKPQGTGGAINSSIVKEQLLYEIGDPQNYLSPDATVSLINLHLQDIGINKVNIKGAKGGPPPVNYKVSATYRDGYRSEGHLTVVGHDAVNKARRAGEVLLKKLEISGFKIEKSIIECLGNSETLPGVLQKPYNLIECVLRIAVHDSRLEAVERFTKEIAPLVTSGPAGVTGYAIGRPPVRPVFGYWPCLIEREKVQLSTELINV